MSTTNLEKLGSIGQPLECPLNVEWLGCCGKLDDKMRFTVVVFDWLVWNFVPQIGKELARGLSALRVEFLSEILFGEVAHVGECLVTENEVARNTAC